MKTKPKTLNLLLGDSVSEVVTKKVVELINDLSNKSIPTLLYEFNSHETWNKLQKSKNPNIYLSLKSYLEDICNIAKDYKYLYDIKCLIIDGLTEILTKERYCLGRSDIVSIIIKELKKMAQELNISIIATAPTNPKFYEFNSDKSKLLSYFCKAETAKDYIDEIILLEKE